MQGQSTAIGDGRQKLARQQVMGAVDPYNTSRSEGTDSRCGRKTKGRVGKQRTVQVFIP